MSQKVWQELLAPKGKKSASDKASALKHNPIKEFQDSPYVMEDPKCPTLIGLMASGFKKAIGTAALRSSGVTKTEISQLIYVCDSFVNVYGLPRVFMAITRSADMNKTPDVRTRALLPEWACKLRIEYARPQLREQSIVNLLAAAGFMAGVGDWRQEKGSGNYGSFEIVSANNPDYLRIVKTMGRKAQQEALDNPIAFNDETDQMLQWFGVEVEKRGFDSTTGKAKASVAKPMPNALVTGADMMVTTAKKPRAKANGASAH